ncbi:MAG: hypothetical protein M3Y22_06575 [Pseudomonadota bacterium]|nr:hypothetical protein [Pseudomonadota bacterium]
MDIAKLIDIAVKLNVPGLVERGMTIAADARTYAAMVKMNADRAKDVLTRGDRTTLDAIHKEAISAADDVDAKLASAAKR